MNNFVKISIIVPIYNSELYLERGVKSILNQTFKEFELLLIDDGSTDKSSIICDKYKQIDSRVKVIHKSNEGVSASRNLGITLANGEFIMFMDSDDTMEYDTVEYLYSLINKYEADVVCCNAKMYKGGILKSDININEEIKVYNNDEIISEYSKNGLFLHAVWNKLYSKRLLEKNKFNENIAYAEDALFNFNILSDSKRLVKSNLPKYNYFINEGSTVTKINEKRLDILRFQCEIFNLLKNKYNKYTENITRDFIKSSISIVIDMANTKIKNKDILIELRKVIRENQYILENKTLVNKKDSLIFNILIVNPCIIFFLYRIRFRLLKLLGKGRV